MSVADQVRGFFARYSNARSRALFEADGNAFHAWTAYRWARRNNEPIPEWVFKYLDRVAERLERTKPTEPKEIARALEMAPIRGGPAMSSRAVKASDRLKAAQMVWALQDAVPKLSDEEIFALVAEQLQMSSDYVKKAYYEFLKKS